MSEVTSALCPRSRASDEPGTPLLISHVLQRLSAYAPLSSHEEEAVLRMPLDRYTMAPRTELVAAGVKARPCFLVSGWACRARALSDGRRQIASFVLPGDALVSPLHAESRLSSCATVALTRVQMVDATPLRPLLERAAAAPGQRRGLWAACAAAEHAEEVLLLDHITAVGQMTAYERLCSLLVELCRRLTEVGLGDGRSFPLPLRQDVLADALGVSLVHVNRTLQQVRREGVAEVGRGLATLLRPDVLPASLAAASAA